MICTYKYIAEVRILILGNFWHIFSNINVMKIVETFNHLLHCCFNKTCCVSCRWSSLCIWINSSQEDPVGEPSAQVKGSLIFSRSNWEMSHSLCLIFTVHHNALPCFKIALLYPHCSIYLCFQQHLYANQNDVSNLSFNNSLYRNHRSETYENHTRIYSRFNTHIFSGLLCLQHL